MSVHRTEIAEFRVADVQGNHVWLELLESRDKGMRFAVPVSHPEHDERTEQKLADASKRDRLELALAEDTEGETGRFVTELGEDRS
jgi:hypothetical protein